MPGIGRSIGHLLEGIAQRLEYSERVIIGELGF
jgi:hypothetical protein